MIEVGECYLSWDGSKYKKRIGRPPTSYIYDTKVDVRITAAENKMLNELSEKHGFSFYIYDDSCNIIISSSLFISYISRNNDNV